MRTAPNYPQGKQQLVKELFQNRDGTAYLTLCWMQLPSLPWRPRRIMRTLKDLGLVPVDYEHLDDFEIPPQVVVQIVLFSRSAQNYSRMRITVNCALIENSDDEDQEIISHTHSIDLPTLSLLHWYLASYREKDGTHPSYRKGDQSQRRLPDLRGRGGETK